MERKKVYAFCDSDSCNILGNSRLISNSSSAARGVVKNVSPYYSGNCPDCGYALFWGSTSYKNDSRHHQERKINTRIQRVRADTKYKPV